jgi:hypothetical protein
MYSNRFLQQAVLAGLVLSLLAGCGGGSSPAPTLAPTPLATLTVTPIPALAPIAIPNPAPVATPAATLAANELRVVVDSGPAGTTGIVNRLYTDVTICLPGSTTQCQTIDHVLVDTGSTGLRLLANAIRPTLPLSKVNASGGFTLINCAQFVDGSIAWGPVAKADIRLGSKTASNASIQIVGDAAFNGLVAGNCLGTSTVVTNNDLGANGIIGLGLTSEDCGSFCASNLVNGFYYTCSNSSCTAVINTLARTADQQVKNPVPLFASDNTGFVVSLPAVNQAGASSLVGSIFFGIGTQANNLFSSGTVLRLDVLGYFTTLFDGRILSNSFTDTGSNGIYFDSLQGAAPPIPLCAAPLAGFYCPAASKILSAQLSDRFGTTAAVSFQIDNAQSQLAGVRNAVVPGLSGDIGNPRIFDWGLPAFYGRKVFVGLEGKTSILGAAAVVGPFNAF